MEIVPHDVADEQPHTLPVHLPLACSTRLCELPGLVAVVDAGGSSALCALHAIGVLIEVERGQLDVTLVMSDPTGATGCAA